MRRSRIREKRNEDYELTMAIIHYNGIGISALSACVPSQIECNKDLGYFMTEEEIQKAIQNIGIEERRMAEKDVCASDLCFKAAEKLIEDNNIDKSSIDALIFVSSPSATFRFL